MMALIYLLDWEEQHLHYKKYNNMNLYNLDTKEKLNAYGQAVLVVTEGINPSEVTGNDRAIALFHFNANFLQQTLTLVVGVYELDANGEPIISKSLIPYEESIQGTNSEQVDMDSEELQVVTEDEKIEGGNYMGEFDAYVKITKENPVELWDLFASIIKKSKKINNNK